MCRRGNEGRSSRLPKASSYAARHMSISFRADLAKTDVFVFSGLYAKRKAEHQGDRTQNSPRRTSFNLKSGDSSSRQFGLWK
jgi:hypothetical protein